MLSDIGERHLVPRPHWCFWRFNFNFARIIPNPFILGTPRVTGIVIGFMFSSLGPALISSSTPRSFGLDQTLTLTEGKCQ